MKIVRTATTLVAVVLMPSLGLHATWSQSKQTSSGQPQQEEVYIPAVYETPQAKEAIIQFIGQERSDLQESSQLPAGQYSALFAQENAGRLFTYILSHKSGDVAALLHIDDQTALNLQARARQVDQGIAAQSHLDLKNSIIATAQQKIEHAAEGIAATSLENQINAAGQPASSGGGATPPAVKAASPVKQPHFALGASWVQAQGGSSIKAKGLMPSVEFTVPKTIPEKAGYIGVQANLFIGGKNGHGTVSYRSNNYVNSDVVTAILSGSEASGHFVDEHLIQQRRGSGVAPWFQVNYHTPKIIRGRVQPFIGAVAAHADRDDTFNVYDEILDHTNTGQITCTNNGTVVNCYPVWDVKTIQKTLISTVPGPKWSGWESGPTVGADIDLWKDKTSPSSFSLRGAYTKIFGPLHPGAWQVGSFFRW